MQQGVDKHIPDPSMLEIKCKQIPKKTLKILFNCSYLLILQPHIPEGWGIAYAASTDSTFRPA
jgi:hypothetical protein